MSVNPTQMSVKLEYGTEKHDRIRNFLRHGIQMSLKGLNPWHDSIRRNEEQQQLYIKKPAKEKGDSTTPAMDYDGKQQYETILIPYAYATTAAAHMYASSVFLSRSPVFQFRGRHGETQEQEMLMEAIINYQVVAASMRKYLFHWLYDPFRYGAGILGIHWDKEIFPMSQIINIPDPVDPNKFSRQMITQPTLGYEGNKLRNVRLLDFFWDTKVGLVDFQSGEFCGQNVWFSWNKFVELHARGIISDKNMEVLRQKKVQMFGDDRIIGSGTAASITEEDLTLLQGDDKFQGLTKNGLTVRDSYWKIVPKAWGLSESPFPERWQFGLAGDEVVVYARPAEQAHHMFPYAGLTYEIDNFAKYPRSLGQFADPFERIMSWLFNSHMYNVRKHLNNNVVVDPSKVVISDFYRRNPGSLIRLKPSAMGMDARTAVHQLQIGDVTNQHMSNVRDLELVGMKVTGVSENLMGAISPGGRKTATEVRSANTFSTNRQKTVVEWFSASGFNDAARQLTTNTQQYLETEIAVKIVGDMFKSQQMLEDFVRVSKDSIAGFYDFETVDGSLPADRFAQANLMRELYALIIGNEMLVQQYDLGALTNYTASLLGVRNLDRFKIQTINPQQQQQMQESGGIIPLRQATGAQ